ncbi:MAG: aminotransferase class I/II-fold pyridoxal phosphate-dependent enzyme, partial [Deltaproteobacteria bacterium]|nr:aminotransferase class I/II-fold pyridoxal phosphate-dependent enzyme [Deltaproteobacteria bacterium]
NMEALEEKLNAIPEEKGALIVTDGVFSMTGEIVNLPELIRVKNKFKNAHLFLDDAHALGTIGPQGEGTAAHFNLTEETDLIMGTFSKSFASMGGFVAGPADVIDYIRHNARAFMFSAAMSPASVATVLACLEIVKKEPHRLANLKKNCRFMLEGFERLGISYIPSETPIISIFIGDEGKALQLVMDLFAEGIFATPVAYPAVPYGQALIRTSYMATHSKEDLTKVLEVFEKLAPKYEIFKDRLEVPTELTHQRQTYNFDLLHEPTSTAG